MSRLLQLRFWQLPCVLAVVACTSGCPLIPPMTQTTVGGQTLPSAYYLRDDVQYFPAGPEFQLTNEVQAHEEYRLQQRAIEESLDVDIAP